MVNGSNKHALVRFLSVCASRGRCPHMHTRMDKLVPHFHVEVAVYKVVLYSRSNCSFENWLHPAITG